MKIIIENKLIHGIPLIECYGVMETLEEEEIYNKPLLFFNHGFESSKEDNYGMLIQLANHGMYVVAPDSFLHGERIAEPMKTGEHIDKEKELFNIVRRTSKDIDYLFEHHYSKHFQNYNVSGISLGGAVAYYCAMISASVNAIAPIIGFPSFAEFGKYMMIQNGIDDSYYESVYESLKEDDPMSHIEKFDEVKILMLHGKNDTVVPDQWTKQLYEKIVERNMNHMVKLNIYEAEHEVTDKMMKDLLAWCVNNLL